jgi:hypothetical protein
MIYPSEAQDLADALPPKTRRFAGHSFVKLAPRDCNGDRRLFSERQYFLRFPPKSMD